MIPLALFLVGLAVGSFLNVLIHRLPAGESVVLPGSRCPTCAAPIRVRDNLPVISWLRLGGRCRDCRARIPVRYPLVEALTGVLFVWAPAGEDPALVVTRVLLLSLLLALAVTDWERMVLPDALTLPGAAAGLVLAGPRSDLDLVTSAAGALLAAGLLFGLRALWLRFRGVEAVGLGDVKLLLLIGAFLGPVPALGAIALAAALGVVVAGPLLLLGRIRRDTPLPFGTLLALGAGAVFVVSTGC
ncbi:MAG: prepilin peptidase [Acidobacteria bacterium]|nr:prepilin peptidase [Acidobacteriota bacterium]MYF77781.1 prepilin peptidase [Acidobacteriota bacterium]